MESLIKIKPRVLPIGVKLNEDEMKRAQDFIKKRNWKMSAFIRTAMTHEMRRIEHADNASELLDKTYESCQAGR